MTNTNADTDRRMAVLEKLIDLALRLTERDSDNADRHMAIAGALSDYGRRQFGPRFGLHTDTDSEDYEL